MTLFHLKSVKSAPKVFTLFEFNLNKFLVILFLLNLILICGMHKTKRRLLLVILISIGVLTLTQPAPLIHNLYEGCWLCISTPYIGVGVYLTSYPYTSRQQNHTNIGPNSCVSSFPKELSHTSVLFERKILLFCL